MPSIIVLVVYALAVARVTRLITADRITQAPRERIATWLWWRACSFCGKPGATGTPTQQLKLWRNTSEAPMLVDLLTCRWCMSIWVSVVAVPLVYLWGERPWMLWPALVLAFSYVTGLLAKLEG